MRPAAVFWDMDGTLVDSEPLWGEATYAMSEEMGRRLTPELRQRTIGGCFENTARICAAHAGITLDAEAFSHYRTFLFSRVTQLFDERLVPRPGIRSLLQALAHDGVPSVVTTNTPRALASHELAKVGEDLFATTICGDEVPQAKPAPDMYRAAARWAGAAPDHCLVFEDSAAGIDAATAAGCRVVAVCRPGDLSLPAGVVCLGEQCGDIDFSTVRVDDVYRWYCLAAPRDVEG